MQKLKQQWVIHKRKVGKYDTVKKFDTSNFCGEKINNLSMMIEYWPVGAVVIGAEGSGFVSRSIKSDTVLPSARHRCDVSSELYCPRAMSRRWAPLLASA